MKTVELFCGTKSFSNYAKSERHETFTVDSDPDFKPDRIFDLSIDIWGYCQDLWKKIKEADIVWMSPPCTTFSIASGNKHWTEDRKPRTREAEIGLKMLRNCKYIAENCISNGKIFFIENPRARARWFLPKEWRKTVWYCQYGDKRAKPTDIWTNLKGWEGKQCHNGNKECHHEPAPRGSKTGTQGLKNKIERGRIPSALFEELFNVIYQHDSRKIPKTD